MAVGDRTELGWPNPPGSYTEELDDGVHAIRMGPVTDGYVERLWAAIAADSDDVAVRQRIAEILAARGQHQDALGQWQEILRRQPDNRCALSSAAGRLREMGRPREAADCYRRALGVASDDPSEQGITRWGLAEALRDAGDQEAARQELAAGIEAIRGGVAQDAASPFLLQRLRDRLTAWDEEREL